MADLNQRMPLLQDYHNRGFAYRNKQDFDYAVAFNEAIRRASELQRQQQIAADKREAEIKAREEARRREAEQQEAERVLRSREFI